MESCKKSFNKIRNLLIILVRLCSISILEIETAEQIPSASSSWDIFWRLRKSLMISPMVLFFILIIIPLQVLIK